jgi:hypothetical protein
MRKSLLESRKAQVSVAILLVALIVVARLLPHAANFTPVAAVGIFAGVFLRGKFAPCVIFAGMLISDFFIGGYGVRGMAIVYGAFGLTFLIGKLIACGGMFLESGRFGAKFTRVFGAAILSSVAFFLITNNIFLYTPSFYPMNFAGMMASYAAGVPFFLSQILGDLVYSGAIFGAYETAQVLAQNYKKSGAKLVRAK